MHSVINDTDKYCAIIKQNIDVCLTQSDVDFITCVDYLCCFIKCVNEVLRSRCLISICHTYIYISKYLYIIYNH